MRCLLSSIRLTCISPMTERTSTAVIVADQQHDLAIRVGTDLEELVDAVEHRV